MLQPESGDSAQLYVGPLIAQLLVSMPGRVGGMLPALLQAIVEKLPHTNSSPVVPAHPPSLVVAPPRRCGRGRAE